LPCVCLFAVTEDDTAGLVLWTKLIS